METGRRSSGASDNLRGHISFNCCFTSTIRRLFKKKRLELGVSYKRLGEFFGINWSTLRKWENGPTSSCVVTFRPKVEGFLNGAYDQILLERGALHELPAACTYHLGDHDPMYMCMERIASAYMLCSHDRRIAEDLMADVENATQRAINRLVSDTEDPRVGTDADASVTPADSE